MNDAFKAQINVKIRPVEMSGRHFLNIDDAADRRIFEPREFIVWHEEFLIGCQQPNAMR